MTVPRLALGTAQLGLDYGITNSAGKPEKAEVKQLLRRAADVGIAVLDTAAAYGDSEEILGDYQATKTFRVVTKIRPETHDDVAAKLLASSSRLRCGRLDTVLLHDVVVLERDFAIWRELVAARERGTVDNIGVSAYYPEDIDWLIDRCLSAGLPLPGVIQIPISVFDQRFASRLPAWDEEGIEVHARSLYLQGVAFLSEDRLPRHLRELARPINLLEKLQSRLAVRRASVLLAYGLLFREITYLVIGVESLARLDELNLAYHEATTVADTFLNDGSLRRTLDDMRVDDLATIIPSNWSTAQ